MPSPTPARKLRLAVIGATYAFVETRKKIQALSEHFEIVCLTCESYTCYGLDNQVADQPQPEDYELIALPALGEPVTTTRYLLRGLAGMLRRHPVDIVLVESEPWAWLRWQSWLGKALWQRGALFGEFSWENIRRTGVKGAILSAAYNRAVATADFVIAGNREAGDLFLEQGLPAKRMLVAPQLGVDESLFRPTDAATHERLRAEAGCGADDFLVGFCGRLEEEKGVLDLLAALETARAEANRPAGEIKLALLGPGSLTPRLAEFARTRPWLRLYPARSHAGIAEFMHMLDLFVLPSRTAAGPGPVWKEQFGHVVIEAMACGVPALGSTCGAIPEVLGEPEQIFAEGDVPHIAQLILAFSRDPARVQRVVAAQRGRLLEKFTNAVIARRWADFLQRVWSDRQP